MWSRKTNKLDPREGVLDQNPTRTKGKERYVEAVVVVGQQVGGGLRNYIRMRILLLYSGREKNKKEKQQQLVWMRGLIDVGE